ncbi:MAG: hypothetical protein HN725_03970 [Alphaproteobacteria bacterium]|jgi:hypothetical protein|nr:hypothetical protein [Alphaproteobacteria bacterium]MBT4082683.1 hypothetical protein [Alphaproteobacteria bacterium]MBT4543655.1 hypothetical protein [Alphaproteobacteria bacterium]MBT7744423.1 hypothetical protein [Alphaproteobacteria bacterium]
MVFSLFGKSIKAQENELRSELSKDKFVAEFETTLGAFKIVPIARPGRSVEFSQVEAAACYVLEEGIKHADAKGLINTVKDLEAAAVFGVVTVEFLGRYWGVNEADRRALQGIVPGMVFPRVGQSLMGGRAMDVVGQCVTKGVVRYASNSNRRKFSTTVSKIESDLSQFVSQRDPVYLDTFARYMNELR